jgi:hypothetical protein
MLENETKRFSTTLWETLTPFERDRVLKRIKKQDPNFFLKLEKPKVESKPVIPTEKPPTISPTPEKATDTQPKPEVLDAVPPERSAWNHKTLYQVAHADMIQQRTTIMEYLLVNYGIESVEKFFLQDNAQWAEKLKVGKMKKIFAKLISKLAPRLVMNKISDIILSNAQYLVPIKHMAIDEADEDRKIIEITKCPVLKEFKKTIKTLKFSNLEERYICTFACIPVIAQMAAVGNCNVVGEYFEKGCTLRVTLKAKGTEMLEQVEAEHTAQIRNGPSK